MPTVVIAYDQFPDTAIESEVLSSIGATILHTGTLTTAEAQEAVRAADAVMVTIQPVSGELIGAMSACKIIARVGTGVDAIDISAATRRSIWVTNVADYSIDEVSNHTLLFLLMCSRRLMPMLESVQRGTWWNAPLIEPAYRLHGQTLGIIGYGRIGQAVASKARGFGLKIVFYDPIIKTSKVESDQYAELDDLLRQSDYVSLHVPLTETTRNLVNAEFLAKMKPSAYLLNTARGAMVDEDALLAALNSGQIAGAALDVFNKEPLPLDHPFMGHDRVIVTPHAAWYSEQAKDDVRAKSAQDVVRVLRGEKPVSPVNQI